MSQTKSTRSQPLNVSVRSASSKPEAVHVMNPVTPSIADLKAELYAHVTGTAKGPMSADLVVLLYPALLTGQTNHALDLAAAIQTEADRHNRTIRARQQVERAAIAQRQKWGLK